jgi:ElaB/YqjD/DUF883 family membrane-anchored ribosome-binding protein
MPANPVGTMYVELSLDATKYTAAQKAILTGAEKNTADINKVFKTVGTQSDEMYNAMRKNIENALNAIKKSHLSSSDEIRRAQESASAKIVQINEQQFGRQNSLIDSVKKNWLALSAGIVVAYAALSKIGELIAFGEAGAKVERTEQAFAAVTKSVGLMGDEVLAGLKKASKGMMDESDIMVKASRLIQMNIPVKTMNELMESLTKQAPIVGDTLPEAWDKLGEALSRGNLRGMKAYVGMVDMENEYRKYADAMGVAVSRLTDEAKQAVMAEVVNQKLKDQVKGLGEAFLTASERIAIAKASIKDAHEEMEKRAIPITVRLYEIWAGLVKLWATPMRMEIKEVYNMSGKVIQLKNAKDTIDEINDYEQKAITESEEKFREARVKKQSILNPLTADQLNSFKKMASESAIVYANDYQAYEKKEKDKIRLEYDAQMKIALGDKQAISDLGIWRANKEKEIEDKVWDMKSALMVKEAEARAAFMDKEEDEGLDVARGIEKTEMASVQNRIANFELERKGIQQTSDFEEEIRNDRRKSETDEWEYQKRIYEERLSFSQKIKQIENDSAVSRLTFIGKETEALDLQMRNRSLAASRQLQGVENNPYASEEDKLTARLNFLQQEYAIEEEYAQKKAELWWNNAQKYIGFAQQMSTMAIQYAFAEGAQKEAIGNRILATAIRFLAQGLQQYMFAKAKEHLINAMSAAGYITVRTTQAAAEMAIGGQMAAAWAAYFAAMSLNPIGGQAFIPAAVGMAAATGAFGVAMAGVSATGAASAATELGMAALWAAGGVAAGAIGEAAASGLEARGTTGQTTVGGGTGGGYELASTPAGPQYQTVRSPVINVYVYGNVVDHDKFTRELIPSITKALGDGAH